MRIVEDQQLGRRIEAVDGPLDPIQKRLIVAQRNADDVGPGHRRGVDVDGEGGVADDDRIARAEQRQAEMAEAFLAADGGDDFGFRVEIDAVLVFVFEATSRRKPAMPLLTL